MCAVPGCPQLATELDHVVPVSQGGTDDRANVQGLCTDHHRDKTQGESHATRPPRT